MVENKVASPGTTEPLMANVHPVTTECECEEVEVMPTPEEEKLAELRTGAGVAAGVVSVFLGGPILAVVVGFGAVYAVNKEGAVGDAARSLGQVALNIRDQAVQYDNKHKVSESTSRVANDTWEKARAYDQQFHVLDRTKGAVVSGVSLTTEFVHKHNLIERGVHTVGTTIEWMANKVSSNLLKSTPHQQEGNSAAPVPAAVDNMV